MTVTRCCPKIKIFATSTAEEIEDLIDTVNDFIKDKEVIDIKYTASIYETKSGLQTEINATDRILVIYKDTYPEKIKIDTPNTTNE